MSLILSDDQKSASTDVLEELADAAELVSTQNAVASSSSNQRQCKVWVELVTNEYIDEKFAAALENYQQPEETMVSIQIRGKGVKKQLNSPVVYPSVRDRDWRVLCEAIKKSKLTRIHRLTFSQLALTAKNVSDLVKALLRRRSKLPSIWTSNLSVHHVAMDDSMATTLSSYLCEPDCKPTIVSFVGNRHATESSIVLLFHPLRHTASLESMTIADVALGDSRVFDMVSDILDNRATALKSLTLFNHNHFTSKSALSMIRKHLVNDTMPLIAVIGLRPTTYEEYLLILEAFRFNVSTQCLNILAQKTTMESELRILEQARRELSRRRIEVDVQYNKMTITGVKYIGEHQQSVQTAPARPSPPVLVGPRRVSKNASPPEHEVDGGFEQKAKRSRRE